MKALIVGLGSIGRRHLNVLKTCDPSIEVGVLREHSRDLDGGQDADLISEIFVDQAVALAWNPRIVFITNPAPQHVATALAFAKIQADLFIEKPMAIDLTQANQILLACKQQKIVVMVGYVLRFLAPLKMVKEVIDSGQIGQALALQSSVGRYLPDWRPGTDYREGISARRDLGGGVVFELSHELDYARWLMGEPTHIGAMTAMIGGFPINVEDVAQVNVRFKSGALGGIHMDMIDRVLHRGCRVSGSDGTVIWDFDGKHRVSLWKASAGQWQDIFNDANYDYQQMYVDQCRHFLECVHTRQQPSVSGEDGYSALAMALAVKSSAQSREVVGV